MPRAIRIHETGGPEVLRLEDVDVASPGEGEVQVQHTAIGVNFIDVYDRSGLYPQKSMPGGLGREAAGVVAALGRKTRGFRVGDRVAYVADSPGSYCELRNVPAARLVKIPAGVSDEQAAVLMLKGITACYLLRHTYRVQRGDFILVHAAAGGVGTLLAQWGRALGAVVIGVVGSEAKARLAKQNGCRHVLVRGRDVIAESVKKISKGAGVHVVYDGVGKDTFFESLDSLRRRGMMVSYGSASGPVPPFSTAELVKRGSLFLTRPTLYDYTATRADLESVTREVFGALKKKWIAVRIEQRYKLGDAAQAHRDLESRKTTGASVIVP
ncbi:MAG TPA: quinone oxidoreductase [Steroidobacteraceae bacterium]|jgi:NADPH:quinone reductase-like Zn-dependent oxidoreductase|nr:quinone oxidoreductase [Steroidobacteraceae bacterium]